MSPTMVILRLPATGETQLFVFVDAICLIRDAQPNRPYDLCMRKTSGPWGLPDIFACPADYAWGLAVSLRC